MEDIAYPQTLTECLLRTPSKLDVGTFENQQELNANFAFISIEYLLKIESKATELVV